MVGQEEEAGGLRWESWRHRSGSCGGVEGMVHLSLSDQFVSPR